MSKPIAATPTLNEADSARFLALVEDGLKHPMGPVPTPKLPDSLKDLLSKPKKLDRDLWLGYFDAWREYFLSRGRGSWPKDSFESLLDHYEALEKYLEDK